MNTYMSMCLLNVTLLELAGIPFFFPFLKLAFVRQKQALHTKKKEKRLRDLITIVAHASLLILVLPYLIRVDACMAR